MTEAASKPCLVLGGNGFVGSAFVREAQRRGYQTLCVDKEEYAAACGSACQLLINANGNSKKYLAAQNPMLEFDLSVRSVLHSLHDFKTARYVYLSSMDVYYPDVQLQETNAEDKPISCERQSPYGCHKFLAEQVVRQHAKDWLVFRMGGFVGQGLWKNSVFDLLTGQPLRVHPDSCYQYLNTADLARIVLDMAEREDVRNDTFNIAGEGLISLRDVAALIPGRRIEPLWETLPAERYELNTAKLRSWTHLPATRDTVQAFVRDWLAAQAAGRQHLRGAS